MQFTNENDAFSQLVISQSAASCIMNMVAKSNIGSIEFDNKRWSDFWGEDNLRFNSSSIVQHLPIFEKKLGKNVPLKSRIVFSDLNLTFGKYDSDITVEYTAHYSVWHY